MNEAVLRFPAERSVVPFDTFVTKVASRCNLSEKFNSPVSRSVLANIDDLWSDHLVAVSDLRAGAHWSGFQSNSAVAIGCLAIAVHANEQE